MARIDNVRIISLIGAIIMSVGLFAASYSTKVGLVFFTRSHRG